jgi:hypothetical protein
VPDMNATNDFTILLVQAMRAVAAASNPDGRVNRRAVLLATHAGLHRPDEPGDPAWDFYTAAITAAVRHAFTPEDLHDLGPDLPAPGPDSPELRRLVVGLVRLLADGYAAAALSDQGSPWRRLVWAQFAHRLDDAIAELQ